MNWTAIKNALVTWVGTASGLGTSKVWWSLQGPVARRANPFITLRVLTTRKPGPDWTDTVDAAVPAAGAEIEHRVRGNRIVSLQIQAFTNSEADASALDLLSDVEAKVRLPSIEDALRLAGIAVLDFEPGQSMDGVMNTTQQESRAVMVCRLSLASEVSETGTYIEDVVTTVTIGN